VLSAPAPHLGYLVEDVEERPQRILELVSYTFQFNVTGQPAISLPLHWTDDGLPIGVQFVARSANEALLIRVAAQLEHSMPWADRLPEAVATS
jgi:amidase